MLAPGEVRRYGRGMTERPNQKLSQRLRLGETLAETLRRVPEMWRGAGGAIGISALAAVVLAVVPLAGPMRAVCWVWLVLASLVAFGAVTRIGVARDLAGARALGLGPFGFQLTRTEARLAGATLLCALFLTIILSLLALVALALFGGAGLDAEAIRARDWAGAGPLWKRMLLAIVGVIVLGAPVLLALRLSLYAQATVGRGRMTSLTVTSLTNGSMLPLFVGLLLVEMPRTLWLVLMITGVVTGPVAVIGGIIVLAAVQAPLTAGFLGAAYRRLERPSEDLAPL